MTHGIEAALADKPRMQAAELIRILEYMSKAAVEMGFPLTSTLIGAASDSLEKGSGIPDDAAERITSYHDFVVMLMTTYIDEGDQNCIED